jgi:hypothetical protein
MTLPRSPASRTGGSTGAFGRAAGHRPDYVKLNMLLQSTSSSVFGPHEVRE